MTHAEFLTLVDSTAGMSRRDDAQLRPDVAWALLVKLRPDISDLVRQGRTRISPTSPTADPDALWAIIQERW